MVRPRSLLLSVFVVANAVRAQVAWTEAELLLPRSDAGLARDPVGGGLVCFGGFSAGSLGDTWRYDGSWHRLTPAGSPSPRSVHAMATDTARGRIVLFGGNASGPLADTWEWDG